MKVNLKASILVTLLVGFVSNFTFASSFVQVPLIDGASDSIEIKLNELLSAHNARVGSLEDTRAQTRFQAKQTQFLSDVRASKSLVKLLAGRADAVGIEVEFGVLVNGRQEITALVVEKSSFKNDLDRSALRVFPVNFLLGQARTVLHLNGSPAIKASLGAKNGQTQELIVHFITDFKKKSFSRSSVLIDHNGLNSVARNIQSQKVATRIIIQAWSNVLAMNGGFSSLTFE